MITKWKIIIGRVERIMRIMAIVSGCHYSFIYSVRRSAVWGDVRRSFQTTPG